jgi:hypothetical protein
MNLTCTNIQQKGASFKENGDLNSFGLRRAVDLIANENLPRAARTILSMVCPVAASTSAYKITKSRRRMADECGATEATIRRNLKKAVDAGILISTLIFDKSENGRGQMPTEYQFTSQFIEAAKSLCMTLDKARDGITAAKTLFAKTLHTIRNIFCGKSTPRSELPATPDQSDRQELVSFDLKNSKEVPASAEKVSVVKNVKAWAEAKHERATTQANDYAERQDLALAKRSAEREQLDKLVRRRAFTTGAAVKRQSTSTSHNETRFDEANRLHDESMRIAAQKAAESKARGFSPASILAKHFPHRKSSNQE